MMFLLWIISVVKKDASIVDSFWGMGFVLTAILSFFLTDGFWARKLLLVCLPAIWGIRLSLYIYQRNHGKGEDFRYRAMREHHGEHFPIVSLYTVFGLQGLLMWIISMPLQIGQISAVPAAITWLDYLGAGVWLIGFLFEAVGDWQLKKFKSDPANKGKVMNRGLWAYTRHPNYFGDALLWWGYFLIALATPLGYRTVFSPFIMTFLLMKVSGVALLEKTLVESRPGYREYVESTSAFFPWPPRRN
ncbi:MAG: DUF1295 domain-containing protein [Blastocatellia bacterium]|nr:DUF1295 domain-containing protein [Blastocatellia bacterium]